ncbi:LYR motif-containing protein 2 [Leptidea sinapis]|uniref:LYR motif-containing protein 2 n=1 Tax=Leptidea sinapis TaxID=189913 RepID=A0A5E4QRS0_9NEOP|nr:LYR motif-containing protein 2 [Leptidea sinapis]VVD00639.1 unnamed protein product [Leptidea sinapis]
MTTKLPKGALSLKQFLLRQEVLKLYKDIFRTLRKVPDAKTRKELEEWTKNDFRNNQHHTDIVTIKSMLHYGRKSLKDLQRSLSLSDG